MNSSIKQFFFLITAVAIISCTTTSDETANGTAAREELTDKGRSNIEMVIQNGQSMEISDIEISPDGRYYLTASIDGTVCAWRTKDHRLLRHFRGDIELGTDGNLENLIYHPADDIFAVSNLNKIYLYDIETGNMIQKIELPVMGTYQHNITEMCWSPDGKSLLVSRAKKFWNPNIDTRSDILLYNIEKKRILWKKVFRNIRIESLDFSPNSEVIAYGSLTEEGTAGILSAENGDPVWETELNISINDIDFNSAGNQIAISTPSNRIFIYDIPSEKLETLELQVGNSLYRGTRVRFSPDDSRLLSAGADIESNSNNWDGINLQNMPIYGWDGMAFVYDIENDGTKRLIPAAPVKRIIDAEWMPDGSGFFTCGGSYYNKAVCQWDRAGNIRKQLEYDNYQITSLDYDDKKSILVAAGDNMLGDQTRVGLIDYIDLSDFSINNIIPEDENIGGINGISIGETGIISATTNGFLAYLSDNGEIQKSITNTCYYYASELDKTNNIIYTLSVDWNLRTLYLRSYSVPDLSLIRSIKLGKNLENCNSLSLSEDGDLIIVPLHDYNAEQQHQGTVKIIETATGNEVSEIHPYDGYIRSDFSPDSRSFVSGNQNIEIFSTDTGTSIKNLGDLGGNGYFFAYNHRGDILISAEKNGYLDILDSSSGKLIDKVMAHSTKVTDLLFSSDDKYLISSSMDGTIFMMNLENGNSVRIVSDGKDWIIFSDDGYFDASAGGGNLVGMSCGMDAFGIDQFALKYNRPDILMERMELGDRDTIVYFYNQYQKRLRKAGIDEASLEGDMHVPEAAIISTSRNGKKLALELSFQDDSYLLKSYNIYVNDVPLFGGVGKSLTGCQQTIHETLELTSGENKIEISCLNSMGAECYRPVTYQEFEEDLTGDLWFVGFGVSDTSEIIVDLKKIYRPYRPGYTLKYFRDEQKDPFWHYAGQSAGTDCVGFVQRCINASVNHSVYLICNEPLGEHMWTSTEADASKFVNNRSYMYCAEDGEGHVYLDKVITIDATEISKVLPGDIFYYNDQGYHVGIIESVDYSDCSKRSEIQYQAIKIIESSFLGTSISGVIKNHSLYHYSNDEGDKRSWGVGRLLQ